jgi:hypothetical protein
MWPNVDRASSKHPDFKGSLDVNGRQYWVSGWQKKEGANPAAPAITFTIKEKDSASGVIPKAVQELAPPADYSDDDMPF